MVLAIPAEFPLKIFEWISVKCGNYYSWSSRGEANKYFAHFLKEERVMNLFPSICILTKTIFVFINSCVTSVDNILNWVHLAILKASLCSIIRVIEK